VAGLFQASPFDGDLAEMDGAGLVTEGVGQLIEREAADLAGWTVSETREVPLLTHVVSHRLGDIRLVELSGNPFGAVRGHAEISGDSDTYLGILYQRFGSTLCRIADDRVTVGPGEICVWHSGRPVSFEMPEKFAKLCMIVPIARFESVL
jgi:AraC-binding-like domain